MRSAAHRAATLAPVLVVAGAALLHAGPQGPAETGWRLDGNVTGRYEYYDVDGDATQSPYRFTGSQPYGELYLSAERRLSGYHTLRAQFLGILNDNQYRNDFDGVVVERASLVVENGVARMPYRLEVGDSFAYFSQRTVQRPVKGLQAEIQSPLGGGDRYHSVQFFTGLYADSWRDLDLEDDFTTGVSWLISDPRAGTWSFNFVNNFRDRDDFTPKREQRQFGVAGQVFLASKVIALDGEFSHLIADSGEGAARVDADGDGWFLQAQNGRPRHPLLYRFRFEQYDEVYRPAGAPIISHRRSVEGHLGWRFTSGLELRGRLQGFSDRFDGPNPLDNLTLGLNLRGPLFHGFDPGLITAIDFFVQDLETRDLAIENRTSSLTLDAWKNLDGKWTPRLRFFWQDFNDDAAADRDLAVTELVIGADRSLSLSGLSGNIGPGMLFRRVRDGVATSNDYYPTLSLNLGRGGHTLRGVVGFESLGRQVATGIDVDTFSFNLLYRYHRRFATIGLEAGNINRDASAALDTDSWRFAGYLTLSFQRDEGALRRREPVYAPPVTPGRLDLGNLAPGTAMGAVALQLEQASSGPPVRVGNRTTYETTLLEDLPQRQSLVIVERDQVLERAALVLDADDLEGRAFIQAFERARQSFIGLYGSPTNTFEDGAELLDIREAVARGAFIRIAEWRRPGGVIRLGVPARLDRRLTIEAQSAESFPPVTDTRWSIADAPQ